MSNAPIRAADLSAMLAANVPALVAHLLPAGSRVSGHWVCGSVRGEPGQSLTIHLHGQRAGVWHDFSTHEKGDALDLVAAVLFNGSTRDAMAWARNWLGVSGGTVPPLPPRPAPEAVKAAQTADDEARRRKALALFLGGQERIAGTPVDGYLAARGIVLAELARQPRALRFHPECWCGEVRRPLPAMLAAITDGAGLHVGTHRTWLAWDGVGAWRKAPLQDAKKTLGRYAGGFIPLWRGASGKPLRDAPAGEPLAVAEGIETALSVALACPELRVIASVALANMGSLILPASVGCVILCADNDTDNPKAAALLDRAAERFAAEGREVRIARPPVGKDFNDTLRAEMPT